ncbi:alanine--tRNA ligase [Xylella fastidiosa subsp. morus]|uniref:alanine--tRNA ligase n=1 Tax=Xylella fastidiosa TaxID=2371 RepID=UPI0003ED0494|nr:alanine--tRNA ligase [Xylella fastidiosa]AIC13285.1 alanyl-tRNA synthetase [Xylella fastidiosa MUL0034]EWG13914.1 alanyl-tRNA synthetase [Xylella fastidiosa Mul-MD]UIN28030.1 alanine--tRNA ligase [Xylella fastidiosa subsp. morus]UIT36773.1 alanine--tRNA ligase [Xylella fastidiosa subsp. morus]UIT39067.1 alanine--tRNA ligase [Xylella fastidiosa subsp. morus]
MNIPTKFTTSKIRSDFLEFFKNKGHKIVPSAPLVPSNDPTLLFTNSGMVQFKDVFLGAEKRSEVRVADVQCCLRAGGKHNDLDSVGYTARHHTFFEMLGNWSFGDYFKKEAIMWAWELLTQVWELPPERLLVTVYHTDDESYALWRDMVGVPEDRIVRIGDNKGAPFASDNFWQMADTGPCGPCTEIFYDHGEQIPGGPPGSPGEDGDRFIEIWNLVFMQFDRQSDGTLVPLPTPCVDTGMGLERLAAILQHVHTNYEIDLFQTLILKAAELTAVADVQNKSLCVIADHSRACAFLIVDGVLPSNEGRGYVLRRIIRRALRHGWMLGVRQPFFNNMVPTLIAVMGDAYPKLQAAAESVMRTLLAEEERFAETLDVGMKIFNEVAAKVANGVIPGSDAFRLYDTYGFPVDLTADIARERGMRVDMAGFEAAMTQQRKTARAAGKFGRGVQLSAERAAMLSPTVFLGYEQLQADDLRVVALLSDGGLTDSASVGDEVIVLTDRTPFYAESGGQVGDIGTLMASDGVRLEVTDTQKLMGQFHGHVARIVQGGVKVGDVLSGSVAVARRKMVALNHSATHLLHCALRSVFGTHVVQKGSLVAPDRLRFDFSHFEPISAAQMTLIERMVNDEVRANHLVMIEQMGMQAALDAGAMALFGEKYGEHVRVVTMGTSVELCGGTHITRTGDVGLFKIISECGVSSGVRRIEAVTGESALNHVLAEEHRLYEVAGLIGSNANNVVNHIRQLTDRQKTLERELEKLKGKLISGTITDLLSMAVNVADVKVVAARLDGLDGKALREALDRLKLQLSDAVIVLAGVTGGKVVLVTAVNGPRAMGKVKADTLLSHVATQINGRGGGRVDFAQGGGEDGPSLRSALDGVATWVKQHLD